MHFYALPQNIGGIEHLREKFHRTGTGIGLFSFPESAGRVGSERSEELYQDQAGISSAHLVSIQSDFDTLRYSIQVISFRIYSTGVRSTHKLNILLTLSGMETKIKTQYLSEWSVVETWNPEDRYAPIPQKTRQDSLDMIESTKTLLKVL